MGGPQTVFVVDGSPVHNVGNLRVHASNWGGIGSWPNANFPFSNAPSAEWPAGSGVEYLFAGGLWVGTLLGGIPSVSTSAYEFEFRPSLDPRDTVYRSALGAPRGHRMPLALADDDSDGKIDEDWLDGFDNDGDGQIDEDFAGISDQMFSRRFRDDDTTATQIYPDHRPLHLAVHEESYAWANTDYDDFVGFTFWITNDGTDVLDDVYVGLFMDGDVGARTRPNYWTDDRTGYQVVPVDLGAHGTVSYDFPYWYDLDGDGGQAAGYCGVVVLDHPTDPSGVTAPTQVGASTVVNMSNGLPFDSGGVPENDFERYEAMSTQTIGGPRLGDISCLVAVGPFAHLAPGDTIPFSIALVVTPRADYTNVERAAVAYQGLWFDLDGNPATGIDGKEHQEHWYLPTDNVVPVAITGFKARVHEGSVRLGWEIWNDEDMAGFALFRAVGSGAMLPLGGTIAGDRREYVDSDVVPGARYEYVLVARGVSGWEAASQRVAVTVPAFTLSLEQNAPNPFRGSTTLSYAIPGQTRVDLAVFDARGRRVATIFSGERRAGSYQAAWDGTDGNGERVSAGIYFCRLKATNGTVTRKLVLVR